LLFDSGGGSGKTFDWGIVRTWFQNRKVPLPQSRWFLAGGIGLHNIAGALSMKPFGIDISSGAETDGVKDREKMIQLVKAVRKGL
jgi:phosphoribosylanthranilate isomerase